MNTLKTLLVLVGMLSTQLVLSQRTYDIRFVLDDLDCAAQTVCYRTQIRTADSQGWNLAGQNYRIFYDGALAEYIDGSATNLLSRTQYTLDPRNIEDAQHVDASNFGFSLPFAADLSFLNYSIDLMQLTTGGINLPGGGQWVSTSEICFRVTDEAIMDPDLCLELVWARMGRTDEYATAFVEVSEWVARNETIDAFTNIYDDLDSEDSEGSCLGATCQAVDPENNQEKCSDGIDNDNDGLIDCEDPSCSEFCPTEGVAYDISLDLESIDCVSGTACYAVNIRSAGTETFILGSQEYRLFYNSAIGTYLSGQSELSNAYQPFVLREGTPIENRNASDLGSLPYESDLGYLSFGMQLNNIVTGGDQIINTTSATKVAEICFSIAANAINNENICFEADWARIGVTNVYDSDVLVIQEWIAANEVETVNPDSYGNLDTSRGDDSCFDVSCSSTSPEMGNMCSDGIDNDNDGLIDCDDPGCSTAANCVQNCEAQAPTLSRN